MNKEKKRRFPSSKIGPSIGNSGSHSPLSSESLDSFDWSRQLSELALHLAHGKSGGKEPIREQWIRNSETLARLHPEPRTALQRSATPRPPIGLILSVPHNHPTYMQRRSPYRCENRCDSFFWVLGGVRGHAATAASGVGKGTHIPNFPKEQKEHFLSQGSWA